MTEAILAPTPEEKNYRVVEKTYQWVRDPDGCLDDDLVESFVSERVVWEARQKFSPGRSYLGERGVVFLPKSEAMLGATNYDYWLERQLETGQWSFLAVL